MANPFDVEVVNPLQSLLLGQKSYDAGIKRRQESQAREILSGIDTSSGGSGYQSAIGKLLAINDLDRASKVATIQKAVAPESSADMQAYGLYQRQGGKLPFLDFKKQLAEAGATRVNTTVNSGEKAYDTTLGKSQAEEFINLQKAGASAPGAIANLDEMERLTKDPNFYSGAGGEAATRLKRIGVGLGLSPEDAAKPNEVFTKLSNKAVLDAAGGSLGTGFSNADRDFLQNANANISNTPEGNRAVIATAKAVQKRNIEVANRARAYAAAHGGRIDAGFYQELSDWAEKNPLFTGSSAGQRSSAPSSSQPPMQGARQGRDGNWYVPDPSRPGKYLQVVQ